MSDTIETSAGQVSEERLRELVASLRASGTRNAPKNTNGVYMPICDEAADMLELLSARTVAAGAVAWEYEFESEVFGRAAWIKNLTHDRLDAERPYHRNIRPLYASPTGARVTVKPLNWKKRDPLDTMTKAFTDVGVYRVWTHHEARGKWFWSREFGRVTEHLSKTVASEADGHAAAQADCEQRILSALSSSLPRSREDVLEEAAKIADADQGTHVTIERVHSIAQGDTEREFWRGYATAKESIAAAIRALKQSQEG